MKNNEKNVIIVHGKADNKEDNSAGHWMPWIKKELEKRKIDVFVPLMPESWKLNYKSWKKEFEKNGVDENSVLIGHSAGGGFLVRWLGETKKKINKLVLVAPWKIPEIENEKEFYDYKIDKCVKKNSKEVIIFTSNNEENNGKESVKIFHNSLDGEIIELKNHGHFTLEDMGTEEFPELLNKVIE
jgi:hypothetical protein